MVANSKEHVAQLVQDYLQRSPGEAKEVRVVAEDVRLGDDQWWWVPVLFNQDPYKRYFFYELFSEIEEQLEEKEHLNVLLIPRG